MIILKTESGLLPTFYFCCAQHACDCDEQTQSAKTLDDRRCDRSESKGSEAIYDCTGGKTSTVRSIKRKTYPY